MDPRPIPTYKPTTATITAWVILGLAGVTLLTLTVYGYAKSSSWNITYRIEASDVTKAGIELPWEFRWWHLILIAIPVVLLAMYWGRDLLDAAAHELKRLFAQFAPMSSLGPTNGGLIEMVPPYVMILLVLIVLLIMFVGPSAYRAVMQNGPGGYPTSHPSPITVPATQLPCA